MHFFRYVILHSFSLLFFGADSIEIAILPNGYMCEHLTLNWQLQQDLNIHKYGVKFMSRVVSC